MPSILVEFIRQSVAEESATGKPWTGCPHKVGWHNLSLSSGRHFPMRCKRHRCTFCGPLNADLVSLALVSQEPTHAIHLTLVGDTWKLRRNRLKQFRHDVAKAGYPFEWAWHIEPNPRGTGFHAHALYRGTFMRAEHIRKLAVSANLGERVTLKWLKDPKRAAEYNTKMLAATYGLKMLNTDAQDAYLTANGERLVHNSRGWWLERGLWASVKAAQVQVRGPPDPGPWISFRVPNAKPADSEPGAHNASIDTT